MSTVNKVSVDKPLVCQMDPQHIVILPQGPVHTEAIHTGRALANSRARFLQVCSVNIPIHHSRFRLLCEVPLGVCSWFPVGWGWQGGVMFSILLWGSCSPLIRGAARRTQCLCTASRSGPDSANITMKQNKTIAGVFVHLVRGCVRLPYAAVRS